MTPLCAPFGSLIEGVNQASTWTLIQFESVADEIRNDTSGLLVGDPDGFQLEPSAFVSSSLNSDQMALWCWMMRSLMCRASSSMPSTTPDFRFESHGNPMK